MFCRLKESPVKMRIMILMRRALSLIFTIQLVSCATSDKGFDHKNVSDIEEFSKVVKIETIEAEPQKEQSSNIPITPSDDNKTIDSKNLKNQKEPKKLRNEAKTVTDKKEEVQKKVEEKIAKAQDSESQETEKKESSLKAKVFDLNRKPKLEDNENFNGRRPLVDPFHVGEEVVMGISYFAVEAGKFTMQIKPMVQLNGKKSYHFRYLIQSSPLFNMFYKVDDVAETFVDYETLLPYSYEIHVDESKQVRETKTFFDHKKLKATMWDQKQKKNAPIEKKKIDWDLKEFSQNVFSAPYYLRNFTLEVGKKFKVHVGHEGKNILMTAEVLRKEKIFTPAGTFNTFVIKPQFDVDGKFKPTGENLLWLTDDDRKFIVRLESKIKIGAIRGEVQKIIKN